MDMYKFLTEHPEIAAAALPILVLLLLGLVGLYVIAFIQGREISVWQFKIGAKPTSGGGGEGDSTPLEKGKVPSRKRTDSTKIRELTGNDLGMGIRIGGTYYNFRLEVICSQWKRYMDTGWVASGWLYAPSWAEASQAVAFFKIHLNDDHTGYIHLLDTANPEQLLWFETDAPFRREEEFCWESPTGIQRAALWRFAWT